MDKLVAVKKLLLPVKLTPDEVTAVGDELSAVVDEHRTIDEERKAVAAKYSARLKALVAKMQILGRKHTAKTEEREVEVEERIDIESGRKVLWRTDDWTIVGPRGPGQEQQLEIAGKRIIDQAEAARASSVPAPGPINAEPPATEEQAAESPEEAEEIRAARIAAEAAATGDEDGEHEIDEGMNDEVPLPDDIPPQGVTQSAHDIARADRVSALIEPLRSLFKFAPINGVTVAQIEYQSGIGENLHPATMEAEGATEDEARDALLEKLILHVSAQADDYVIKKPKATLKAPKKPKNKIVDENGNDLLAQVTEKLTPETQPLCEPECAIQHEHTAERTAF